MGRFDQMGDPFKPEQRSDEYAHSDARERVPAKNEISDELRKILSSVEDQIRTALGNTTNQDPTKMSTLFIHSHTTPKQLEDLKNAVKNLSEKDRKGLLRIEGVNLLSAIEGAKRMADKKPKA